VPLAVAVSGANTHDKWLVEPTLESMAIERPEPTPRKRQHFCADKGYDYEDVRELVNEWGYTAHIKSRGEEEAERRTIPGYRARRWVVERTHSWFNRFRRLLIRWEKKSVNYVALLHFACAWITFRAAGVLG
jgi:putative transposase